MKAYVPVVTFRRIIIALCLLALLPTTVDPSCVGYFMYASMGTAADAADDSRGDRDGIVTDASRPTEGLAAARIPSQSRLPDEVIVAVFRVFAPTLAANAFGRVERSPDFLAPARHDSFLRHSSLLI